MARLAHFDGKYTGIYGAGQSRSGQLTSLSKAIGGFLSCTTLSEK